jgi:hypothetical protein
MKVLSPTPTPDVQKSAVSPKLVHALGFAHPKGHCPGDGPYVTTLLLPLRSPPRLTHRLRCGLFSCASSRLFQAPIPTLSRVQGCAGLRSQRERLRSEQVFSRQNESAPDLGLSLETPVEQPSPRTAQEQPKSLRFGGKWLGGARVTAQSGYTIGLLEGLVSRKAQ